MTAADGLGHRCIGVKTILAESLGTLCVMYNWRVASGHAIEIYLLFFESKHVIH
jgi:hypothetical protein